MTEKIDTLNEKQKWYLFVKDRITKLEKKEEERGEMSLATEIREHVTLAMTILERIRAESSKIKSTDSMDMKKSMFGNWEKNLSKDPVGVQEASMVEDMSEANGRRETE